MGALQTFDRWAVSSLIAALIAAPVMTLAALLAAHSHIAAAASDLAAPFAMNVLLAVASACALGGALALRRSSLPGGGRPARFMSPGALPAGRVAVAPEMTVVLMQGSLAFSATIVNGLLFTIVATLNFNADNDQSLFGPLWPAAISGSIIAGTLALFVRGSIDVSRGGMNARADLHPAWRAGAFGAIFFFVLLLGWPSPLALKSGMGFFMGPLALAAVWGAHAAWRHLQTCV